MTCSDKTSLSNLQSELAFRGCTWALKTCPSDIYSQPANFYHTIAYKDMIEKTHEDNNSEEETHKTTPVSDFLTTQFEQFELYFDKELKPNLDFSQYPTHINHYNLTVILRNYFKVEHPTDKQIFTCLCLLYGWCCKYQAASDDVALFCFITGNKLILTPESLATFDPIGSHYWWSPWSCEERARSFFNKLQHRKTSFSSDDCEDSHAPKPTRRLLKRHSVSDCNNVEVQKFMQKLTNIRRRKRRASQLNTDASLKIQQQASLSRSKSFTE